MTMKLPRDFGRMRCLNLMKLIAFVKGDGRMRGRDSFVCSRCDGGFEENVMANGIDFCFCYGNLIFDGDCWSEIWIDFDDW